MKLKIGQTLYSVVSHKEGGYGGDWWYTYTIDDYTKIVSFDNNTICISNQGISFITLDSIGKDYYLALEEAKEDMKGKKS